MSSDLWIILTGSLVAASAAILGCFLILRRMAMIGDAISHAVLPGIVIAYLLSGSLDSVPMLLGAAAFGVLTSVLIEMITKKAKLQNDAAIGLVFTFLFALGVIMMSAFTGNVHLDTDCVLYGEIMLVPFDRWITSGGIDLGPIKVWTLGAVFLITCIITIIGFKGLSLTTFDPFYAASIGISTAFWHYMLMSLVSLVTVVSFEAVGAILVVAFLVAPAAIAYLLTDDLVRMILIAIGVGILSAFLGYYLASWIDGSIPGAMTTVLGLIFILTLLFSPSRGLIRSRT